MQGFNVRNLELHPQLSTGFPPDPFASLIDGSILTAPTQILENCGVGLADPLPEGIGPVQTVEKSSVYHQLLHGDDGALNQQKIRILKRQLNLYAVLDNRLDNWPPNCEK